MAHVSKVVISQSQNVTIEHSVQQLVITNGLPNWLYIRVGGSDLPNANTADIAVAPLSMGAFPIVPTRNFGITVGDLTVLATTNVPITQAVCMFYEVPEPVTLGQVPLSPGGFRFRKVINNSFGRNNNDSWQIDLSNFTFFRYTISTVTTNVWWRVVLFSNSSFPVTLGATFVLNTPTSAIISGVAGCVVLILLQAQDSNGLASSITVLDQMEAW